MKTLKQKAGLKLKQKIGLNFHSGSTRVATLGCAAFLAAGMIAGCDSGDSSSNVETSGGSPAKEITPGQKNPESAGGKSGKSPDDVISERPGGPGTRPVQP